MNKIFRGKNGTHISDSRAQSYGERLYQLMLEKGETSLTPNEVVDDAKNENTPYHDFFEWDDKKASHSYRKWQARFLIDAIVEVKIINEVEKPIRTFHNVVITSGKEKRRVYAPSDVVFTTPDLYKQVIKRALEEAENWTRRYESYKELSKIVIAIKNTVKKNKRPAEAKD